MPRIRIDLYEPGYEDINADWLKSLPEAQSDEAAYRQAMTLFTPESKEFHAQVHAALKHIMGRHNQRYHGNRGAAGTLGRGRGESRTYAAEHASTLTSAPAPRHMTAAQELDFDVVKRARYYWKPGDHDRAPLTGGNRQRLVDAARKQLGEPHFSTTDEYKKQLADPDLDMQMLRQEVFSNAPYGLRSQVKARVASEILTRMGPSTTTSDVAERISSWAGTSNDDSPDALAMQSAAAKAFGVELSDWQKGKIAERASSVARSESRRGRQDQEYWNAVRDNTQEFFAKAGYHPDDTITVYRGVTGKGQGGKMTGKAAYKGNAVESWSLDVGEARLFADTEAGGVILSAQVRIGDIVSSFLTGPGCLNEMEVLVLGSLPGQEVYVYDISE